MSRIRMKVFIRNESDVPLFFFSEETLHGSYTDGWLPPARIEPGQRLGFQGEGDLILVESTVGTEGVVKYRIGSLDSADELYIHWDSPRIKSAYANTFHIWGPPHWEVSHWGGQGNDTELEIRLRRTQRRAVPHFHPHGRAFIFLNNQWSHDLPSMTVGYLWNKLLDSLPGPLGDLGIGRVDDNWLPFTDAGQGMCGGMVYTVMDYHANHLLPPEMTLPPSSRDDPLFTFVRDRLWDSFDVDGQGHRALGYSSPHYPNGDEGVIQNVAGLARGRSWVTYREEWPRIQDDIDAGRLSPVMLIQTDNLDIGRNHQVLVYAYERSAQDVTLYLYDPNFGQQEVSFCFNVTATDGEVRIQRSDGEKRIWCLFRINGYTPKLPPAGRRINSVKQAIRASTGQLPPYSVRVAMASNHEETDSVQNWMRRL